MSTEFDEVDNEGSPPHIQLSPEYVAKWQEHNKVLRGHIKSVNRVMRISAATCLYVLLLTLFLVWSGILVTAVIYLCVAWYVYREYRKLLLSSLRLGQVLFHAKAMLDCPNHAEFHFEQYQASVALYSEMYRKYLDEHKD